MGGTRRGEMQIVYLDIEGPRHDLVQGARG